ncbi:MAG: hypothetical protein ABSE75_14305 [Acidimicrobiales bacterium]|jgi:hypothetical protein
MKIFKIRRKTAVIAVAFAVVIGGAGAAFAYWTSSGNGTGSVQDATATGLVITQDTNGTPSYDSLVPGLPASLVSEGFESDSISELGNEVGLAGSAEPLNNVVVTMEDWACGNWASSPGDTVACSSTPGTSFSQPITLTIYNDAGSGVVGSVIATATQSFNIPYRPSYNAACGALDYAGGEWLDNSATATAFGVTADNKCHHGLADNITFDFSSQDITLPSTVIYGISFNTTNYGADPTAAPGPYDSLNVGLNTSDVAPSLGTDTNVGQLDMNSSGAEFYCNGTDPGTFRLDSPAQSGPGICSGSLGGWSTNGSSGGTPYYLPAVEFNVSSSSGDLYPGGPAQPINFSVTNPGTISEGLNGVTIAVSSVTNQHPTAGDAECLTSWYAITQPNPTTGGSVAAGATYDENPSGASISLTNIPTQDQDACQGATVNLTFTSS